MITNNVTVFRGTSYEVIDIGTQTINWGTWVTVRGGEQLLIIDEPHYHADETKEITKPEQPFWSKQGKSKKGGKRKY